MTKEQELLFTGTFELGGERHLVEISQINLGWTSGLNKITKVNTLIDLIIYDRKGTILTDHCINANTFSKVVDRIYSSIRLCAPGSIRPVKINLFKYVDIEEIIKKIKLEIAIGAIN